MRMKAVMSLRMVSGHGTCSVAVSCCDVFSGDGTPCYGERPNLRRSWRLIDEFVLGGMGGSLSQPWAEEGKCMSIGDEKSLAHPGSPAGNRAGDKRRWRMGCSLGQERGICSGKASKQAFSVLQATGFLS